MGEDATGDGIHIRRVRLAGGDCIEAVSNAATKTMIGLALEHRTSLAEGIALKPSRAAPRTTFGTPSNRPGEEAMTVFTTTLFFAAPMAATRTVVEAAL